MGLDSLGRPLVYSDHVKLAIAILDVPVLVTILGDETIQYCNQYLLVLSNEINTRKYRIILETGIVKKICTEKKMPVTLLVKPVLF